MKIKVIAIEETEYLGDAALKECGRYFGLYVYDAEQHTYCCEITPSHWLEAVGFVTENEISDDLQQALNACLYDSSHYRHARDVTGVDLGDGFDSFDDAVEYCRCNLAHAESLAMKEVSL